MAVKVGLENNILKIDDGVKIEYFNAAWCSMFFSSTSETEQLDFKLHPAQAA